MSVRYGAEALGSDARGQTALMKSAAHGIARAGLIAKGVVYGLLAMLAVHVALGDPAQADSQGALRSVARQPLGGALLGLLAIGLFAYALWQAYEAWSGDDSWSRITAGMRFLVWGAMGVTAVKVLLHDGVPDNREVTLTAEILNAPFGTWLVAAVGLGLIAVGLIYLRHLRGHRYFDDLNPLPPRTRSTVKAVTIAGIAAKAGVYALVGAFVVRAAARHKPGSGVGLDGALSQVARQPYGTYVLVAVAGGFAAYAVWCWVRARYENIERSDG